MPVTLQDIAKKSGYSISTVSRVFNDQTVQYRISGKTAKYILKIAAALNYKPNQLARGLRLKKSHTIGLIIPDISNPFFAYLIRIVQRVSHRLGYSLVVCDTDENVDLEMEHIDVLMSKGVDGLIIMPVGQKSGYLRKLLKEKIPFVLVDRSFDGLKTDSVVVDNYRGALQAVEHLISFGHTRIAMIQGLRYTSTNNGRVRGYKDALRRNGLRVDETLLTGNDFRQENGYRETKHFLAMDNPPTAIFTTSDLITLGALQAISEAGLRVPEDISLVAFDDMDFAPYLMCSLTSVAQPKEGLGETAVRLLVDRLKNHHPKRPRTIVLAPELIIRNSVGRIELPAAHTSARPVKAPNHSPAGTGGVPPTTRTAGPP